MIEAADLILYDVRADFHLDRSKPRPARPTLPEVRADEIACCLTIYNEPAAALLVSIAALMRNMRFLQEAGDATLKKELTLCIIADGLRSLSPSAVETLQTLGLFNINQGKEFADLRVYERTVNSDTIDTLLGRLDLADTENQNWMSIHRESLPEHDVTHPASKPVRPSRVNLRILACIKKENAGKLNSHCWFFSVLCPAFKPKYCLQMDAGTAPKPAAVHRLINSLENDPDIGAAASMILVHASRETGSLLHLWQYGDFALQKLLEWPAEMLCGYLTVIPGQFCVFRWSALTGVAPRQDDWRADLPLPPQAGSPLDQYFRGMNPLGPFEANMFLAEDRILGFEILSQRNTRWKLHYENTAVAITDSCDSLPELFRQRRRWTNSSFTCNLWLITRVGSYLRNSAAPFKAKLRTLVAVPWLCLNMAFQWLLPALVIFYFKQFVDTVEIRTGHSSVYLLVARGAYFSFLGLLIAQIVLHAVAPRRIVAWVFYVFAAVEIALFVFSFTYASGLLFTAFCAESFAALLFALIHSRAFFGNLIKIIAQYTVLRPAMMLSLNIYSLCNLHNCSWGTKGLLSTPSLFTPSRPSAKSVIETEFYKFQAVVMILWLLSNASAIWVYYNVPADRLEFPFKVVGALLIVLFGIKLIAGFSSALRFGTRTGKTAFL